MADSGSLFSIFGWVPLAVATFIFFNRIESLISHDLKLRVRRWLKNADPPAAVAGWLPTFVELFDRVLGAKHLSWKCFRRSCEASIGAVLLVTAYWAVSRPSELLAVFTAGRQAHPVQAFFALTVVLSLMPDYISLLKSRLLIGWMNRRRTVARLCFGVFIDLSCTVVLVCLALLVNLMLRQVLIYGWGSLLLGFMWRVNLLLAAIFTFSSFYELSAAPGLLPVGIWPWATLFTTGWALLYAVAGALLKLAKPAAMGLSAIRRTVDIDKKPISAVGVVAAGIVAVVGALVSLALWLRGGPITLGLGLQQFLTLMIMLALIAGAAYGVVRLELYLSRHVAPDGLAGWLLLVGLGVLLTPLAILWRLYSELYPALIRLDWHLMHQEQVAITLLRIALFIVAYLSLGAWATYNVVLFFRKCTRFRLAWIGLNGLFLVISLVGAIFDAKTRQGLLGVLFWSALWIAYMLRSRRVKNTFVR